METTKFTLPPYNPDAVCPKCGGASIHTAYHRWPAYACPFPTFGLVDAREHMDRTCRHCGYSWSEECLDRAGEEDHETA